MAFSSFEPDDSDVMNEINMTPLVDVMLVLLIVFIITVPVLNHAVPLSLPQASSEPEQRKPDAIQLGIDAQGALFWNGQALPASELQPRLQAAATQQPQPQLQLQADRNVRYEAVAQTLAAAQQAGLSQVGFVTEPQR